MENSKSILNGLANILHHRMDKGERPLTFKEMQNYLSKEKKYCKGCGKEITWKWEYCCACTYLEDVYN
jgi:hypothetical protein